MTSKALAKMYSYENLIYYDNALYEHNHNHTSEKQKTYIGDTKMSIRNYHNENMMYLLTHDVYSTN